MATTVGLGKVGVLSARALALRVLEERRDATTSALNAQDVPPNRYHVNIQHCHVKRRNRGYLDLL